MYEKRQMTEVCCTARKERKKGGKSAQIEITKQKCARVSVNVLETRDAAGEQT